jgi:curved DNA-binding protein
MWPRTRSPERRSSRRSTRPTRCWAIRRSGGATTSWAPTGRRGGAALLRLPGRGNRGQPARRGRASSDFEFGGTGFSDFFESFFGGGRAGFGYLPPGGGRRPGLTRRGFAHQGQDVEADILVTLEEALRGSRRKVTLAAARRRRQGRPHRHLPGPHPARRARGPAHPPRRPGGRGLRGRARGRSLPARAPRAPSRLQRAGGRPSTATSTSPPGRRCSGAGPKIPTLDGATSLRVPPGTAAGSQLRLRGLGLPREDASRGDLYAVARIQVPLSVSAAERPLWEKLAASSTFKPRKTP